MQYGLWRVSPGLNSKFNPVHVRGRLYACPEGQSINVLYSDAEILVSGYRWIVLAKEVVTSDKRPVNPEFGRTVYDSTIGHIIIFNRGVNGQPGQWVVKTTGAPA